MKKRESGTLRKVLSLVHKLTPGYLALLLIIKMLSAALPFIGIFFSSKILDGIIRADGFDNIFKNVIIMISLVAVTILLQWGLEIIQGVKKFELKNKINQMISLKTMDIDYDILEKHETLDMIKKAEEGMSAHGDIMAFCENLAGVIERIATIIYSVALLVPLFIPKAGVLSSDAGLFCVFLNKWYSLFLLAAVLVLHVLVSFFTNKKVAKIKMDWFERNVTFNRYFSYWFNLIFDYSIGKYIRLYKMQNLITKKIVETNDKLEGECRLMVGKNIKVMFFPTLSEFVLTLTSYAYVGLKAVYALISTGSSLLYISAYKRLVDAIAGISQTFIHVKIESRYLSFFYDYMQIENKRYEGTIPTEKRDDNVFEIEFRDVSFKYANTETYALCHVNQKIKLGTKNAVVGKNGAGKTTFIKLLCRLYEPTEGQILLNGVDIRYYDYKDYAALFSVVFQDFNLFSFPVGENIAAGTDYDKARVIECIEKSGFKARFDKFEKGLDTPLFQYHDENGVEISGGEAQKLAIARALYKDAPFVIMDEPTSALDPVAEYEIYKKFDEMVEGKTSIYISHRMSSCRFCDNILVFDEGKIVEQGNHDKLMQNGGLYSSLWNAQAQYYA